MTDSVRRQNLQAAEKGPDARAAVEALSDKTLQMGLYQPPASGPVSRRRIANAVSMARDRLEISNGFVT